MARHEWEWIGQEERFAFGDPDKPYAVDVYRCRRCGKRAVVRGDKCGPASGGSCKMPGPKSPRG